MGQLCGLFLTSLEGEAANSSERSGNSARCHGAVSSCLATARRSPTLVLYLFSFPDLTKPQKSKMTPKKPVIGLCKPSPRLWMGHRAVSLLLLTQVCLPGSRVPVPCLGTCAALRFMLWADRGFMAHSSPIPPQDSAPLPAAVKTTHSYPAERQVVHRGELLRNSAQFWPKGFASCPSPGDKNAKYNAE